MAAGLGFKTFTTGEVLTADNVNGYLMQGVLVFASAAARDAAITSPQEGQCCYLKDTDAVLTYSGSAWVGFDDSNAIQNTIVDAKGDLIGATAADTPARLAVGANDTVLIADSAETTGMRWGGGWTTWTPTLANFTLGNGTVTARYQQIGKTVNFSVKVILGSTSSVTGAVGVSLPANNAQNGHLFNTFIGDVGVGNYNGLAESFDNYVYVRAILTNSTYSSFSAISSTVPFTWTTNDYFFITGSYEVA